MVCEEAVLDKRSLVEEKVESFTNGQFVLVVLPLDPFGSTHLTELRLLLGELRGRLRHGGTFVGVADCGAVCGRRIRLYVRHAAPSFQGPFAGAYRRCFPGPREVKRSRD
jgi:hypothetical protein